MPTFGICRASMGHQSVCFGTTLEILHSTSEFSIHVFSSFPPLNLQLYVHIVVVHTVNILTHLCMKKCAFTFLILNQFSSVIGGWSEDGLTTHHSNGSTVVNCSSRHLTSFAVLVNAAGTRVRVNRNSQFNFQKDAWIHV